MGILRLGHVTVLPRRSRERGHCCATYQMPEMRPRTVPCTVRAQQEQRQRVQRNGQRQNAEEHPTARAAWVGFLHFHQAYSIYGHLTSRYSDLWTATRCTETTVDADPRSPTRRCTVIPVVRRDPEPTWTSSARALQSHSADSTHADQTAAARYDVWVWRHWRCGTAASQRKL